MDKGAATIILTSEQYHAENLRQLNNNKTYAKLEIPIYNTANTKIQKILKNMHAANIINNDTFAYLMQNFDNPGTRIFYTNPKAHKPQDKWINGIPPGRPIISDCGTATHPVSEYIDTILQPAMKHIPAYLKDSYDTIDKITSQPLPENIYLGTADVESLYTNIPTEQGIECAKETLTNMKLPPTTINYITQLMEIILTHNDFQYNRNWYLQLLGTAMGISWAPCYANMFLNGWETKAHNAYTGKKPILYFRYIDDIIFCFEGTQQELEQYQTYMANYNPNVRLTFEISQESVNFLDITFYKGRRFNTSRILDHKVHFKPTDTHSLLHRNSCHPQHTFNGIIKSQILRFQRLCNNKHDFEKATKILFTHLTKYRGYTNHRKLYRIKKEYISEYTNTSTYTEHLKTCMLGNITFSMQTIGSTKCMNKNKLCGIHDAMINTKTITSTANKSTFKISKQMDCSTSNLVYVIQCSKCKIQYVGETGQTLRQRASNHKYSTKTKNDKHILYNHYRQKGHNMTFIAVEKLDNEANKLTRLKTERNWIEKLDTYAPKGLNMRRDSILNNNRTPFIHTYHPKIDKLLPKTLKELWQSFSDNDPHGTFIKYFPNPPLVSYRRNKNLGDILTRSKFILEK